MMRKKCFNMIWLQSSTTAVRKTSRYMTKKSSTALRNLKFVEKLRCSSERITKRIVRTLTFIQGCFDKIVPYKQYDLPSNVYTNEDHRKINDDFIKKLSDNYQTLEK